MMTLGPHQPGWSSNHDHVFGQDRPTGNEKRTLIVVAITAVMMVVEIAAGLVFGSMALLADGLHMASHAIALGIAAFAYRYARKCAADPRFSFGTGKVNALAGFTGAVLLGVFSLGMAGESIERFVNPVNIAIDQALVVAVLGLIVNGASVFILGHDGHGHGHDEHSTVDHHHHDHNLRSAYFHVLADALTSLIAIGALLAAKFFGQTWLDPMMGIVGALLVGRWSLGLLRQSAQVLLDRQASQHVLDDIRGAIESVPDTQVVDLHVWSIGTGRRAAIIAIESSSPLELDEYRSAIPSNHDLVHVTIEVGPAPAPNRESR
jgi:cation diffusion facilitator family transporter